MALVSLFALGIFTLATFSFGCETGFDGFGIYVGTHSHSLLNFTNATFTQLLIDRLYSDLKLRYFRINYPPKFSPSEGQYTLDCAPPPSCPFTFELMLGILSSTSRYPGTSFFASIWSPPEYMKDRMTNTLNPQYQQQFHYYITNVTHLIYAKYGIHIEKVSPVNEPENVFATWDHTNMDPNQLCQMIHQFNDPLTSLCPENSYFWITELYLSYKTQQMNCLDACSIVATHAYALNVNLASPNFRLATYDLTPYPSKWGNKRIWMTEVSNTFMFAAETQMEEGFDLATNIINFLGTTCVERYYFWLPFSEDASGESLIWGNRTEEGEMNMKFPKKYFIFKQFSTASYEVGRGSKVTSCDGLEGVVEFPGRCLIFVGNGQNVTVFLNPVAFKTRFDSTRVNCTTSFCCTTKTHDYKCKSTKQFTLPAQSLCTCK